MKFRTYASTRPRGRQGGPGSDTPRHGEAQGRRPSAEAARPPRTITAIGI